ncbi:AAA family ATPase [Nocardia sp. NPDC004568]|uniref:ATP-binding protein n=1 Tax=Nocardia sp. NPDC004568 TaxID=3154551 RepID=UPI0033BA21AB
MQQSLATVFVGRDTEVAALLACGRTAVTGRGAVVLVEGEAGIGKTTLLGAAARQFAELGLQVRTSRARELQQDVPFAALAPWLVTAGPPVGSDPVRALLDGADQAGDVAATHEFALAELLLEQIRAWCAEQPVALLLDDVHWADRSSLAVLHRLCALADRLPLVLVLATRPFTAEPAFAMLTATLTACAASTIRLGALPDAAATTMVREMVGAAPAPALLRQVAGAYGHPLHIRELVAASLLDAEGRQSAPGSAPQPVGSLAEAIWRRAESLSRPTRDLLPMAAALGPKVDVVELAAVLDGHIMEVWSAVTEATDAGLLTMVDSELAFRHELIRHVLAERVPASLRSDLLRRAGRVLQTTGAPIERVAYYLSIGGRELDPASLQWLLSVSDALIVRAPELAMRLLTRIVDTAGLDTATRAALIRMRTRALLWNGRTDQAEATLRVALRHRPEHADDPGLRWLLAHVCHAQGRLAEAVEVAETALNTLELDDADAARFLGLCALDNFFLERFAEAEQAGWHAVALGRQSGNSLATGYGLMALGAVRYTQGYLDEALEISTESLTVLQDDTGSDQIDPYVLYAHCLIELDRPAAAAEALQTAIGHNRRMHGVYLAPNLMAKARMLLLNGHWDEAVAECRACLEAPDVLGYAPVAHSVMALIGMHRGAPPPADALVPDDRLGTAGYGYMQPWVAALVHETKGNPEPALRLLVETHVKLDGGMSASTLHYLLPDIARLAFDTGDSEALHGARTAADEVVAKQWTASRSGIAQLCRGLADRDPEALFAAAREFARCDWPLYEAQAYEDAAIVLAESGRGTDARDALESAVQLYTRLGASWDTARAVARIRRYGIRRGVRGPRNRPKTGWASLTDTERSVAVQVADGSSNADIAAQMFLSRRTVQSHVSSILAKLGVRSRRDIAAAMAAAGR